MKTVCIFGGSGFLGKHIIRRLSKFNYKIIIPISKISNPSSLKIYGNQGQIIPIEVNNNDYNQISNILDQSNYIINLRTIWTENSNRKFNKEILDLNKLIVNILKNDISKKFIYFSGLGINIKNKSLRIKSIYESEKYIIENMKNYIIFRPSIIIGHDDKFLNKLIKIFNILFIIPLFGSGDKKFQPTYVDDVALGVEKILNSDHIMNKIYELGGNKIYSYREFYYLISKTINKKRIFISLPFTISLLVAFIFEKFKLDIINREQINLFKYDNLVNNNVFTYSNLNIKPTDTDLIIEDIIINKIL